ncbi:3-phosphoshikimate 1-carboxyvinyltransferase [Lachnospiraceae bacterium]|nr:3-phosphoshikimate 1-carboxyvinyltransferase [Lachnospiraceae bacterium]
MNTNDIKNDKITYDESSDLVIIDASSADIDGRVRAIASKSHAHRLLIAAALSDRQSRIITSDTSKDIEATIGCLNALGATITRERDYISVTPISISNNPVAHSIQNSQFIPADCGESGSTLRFMIPIIGALGINTSITMHGRLSERPLSPMYEELIAHGMQLSPQGSNPLFISGRLNAGEYTIAGNISSQFVTGLLLALPIVKLFNANEPATDNDYNNNRIASPISTLHVTGRLESRPYVDITLDALKSSDIFITEERLDNGDTLFHIPADQTYHVNENVIVDGDWSNAAFFLAAGAIMAPKHEGKNITMNGLNTESLQGDKKVLSILEKFGADIQISEDNSIINGNQLITISPAPLHGIDIDAADIPDLVPILSVVASVAEGTTTIRNIERLRIKESDRVKTVIETLSALGADIYEENNTIVINGKEYLAGGAVDSFNDHRIAMAAAIASLRCKNKVIIKNPRAVDKSYPGFYDDLIQILH